MRIVPEVAILSTADTPKTASSRNQGDLKQAVSRLSVLKNYL